MVKTEWGCLSDAGWGIVRYVNDKKKSASIGAPFFTEIVINFISISLLIDIRTNSWCYFIGVKRKYNENGFQNKVTSTRNRTGSGAHRYLDGTRDLPYIKTKRAFSSLVVSLVLCLINRQSG